MITVYHINYPLLEAKGSPVSMSMYACGDDGLRDMVRQVEAENAYRAVARVNTDSLDTAFRDTNHIHCDWADNEGVEPLVIRARSTSVGDILVRGKYRYIVARVGFVLLDEKGEQYAC